MIEKALFVHTSEILVVDEADMMLDMGFIEDLDQVAAKMPRNCKCLYFQQRFQKSLKPFLKKYMENPKMFKLKPKEKQQKI